MKTEAMDLKESKEGIWETLDKAKKERNDIILLN